MCDQQEIYRGRLFDNCVLVVRWGRSSVATERVLVDGGGGGLTCCSSSAVESECLVKRCVMSRRGWRPFFLPEDPLENSGVLALPDSAMMLWFGLHAEEEAMRTGGTCGDEHAASLPAGV